MRRTTVRPERPDWIKEGALIHRVSVVPPSIKRITKVWGPSYEGRVEICWQDIFQDEAGGMIFNVEASTPKEWRVVTEMEAIALHSMSRDEYLAWMKEWNRKQRTEVGGT